MDQSTVRTTRTDELEVSREELELLAWKLVARETAPGQDGIPGRASALARGALRDRTMQLVNECQQEVVFPIICLLLYAVLFKKQGKTLDSRTAYRSSCLSNEARQLLERVLAIRLKEQLLWMVPHLYDKEYDFQRGRSTFDALRSVCSLSEAAVHPGGVVSLASS
ncbi:uncharacterized protein LOC143220296 [Lasioglossum baleicum]|uniref:uncharacterized protein LOC143220296 n=1 Tax=Lasioglossum baleicum TaxID=434251 RepID=UPI003FCC4CFE